MGSLFVALGKYSSSLRKSPSEESAVRSIFVASKPKGPEYGDEDRGWEKRLASWFSLGFGSSPLPTWFASGSVPTGRLRGESNPVCFGGLLPP